MKRKALMVPQLSLLDYIAVDNFAGGGGASTGMELALGRPVTIAINHDPAAILMHKTNHPYTTHYQASVWDVDPVRVCAGRPVGVAWFSPDCKHFSKAKGAALVDRNIRGLAWIALRWAGTVRPKVIILENVEEFVTWGPVRKGKPIKSKKGQTFRKFVSQFRELGYCLDWRELVAADYGVPNTSNSGGYSASQPIDPARTGGVGGQMLVGASLMAIGQTSGGDRTRKITEPTHTQVSKAEECLISASLIQYHTEQTERQRGQSPDDPLSTVDSSNRYGLTSAILQPCHAGGYHGKGNSPTVPLNTVTGTGGQSLVSANLVEYYGAGRPLDIAEPMHTVTSHDREALTAAHLAVFKGQDIGQPMGNPLRTITASTGEFGEVRAIITKYASETDLQHWSEIRTLLNRYCGYHLAEDEVLLLKIGNKDYLKRPDSAPVPLMADFKQELDRSGHSKASELSLALERFVDGYLNSFAAPTNINSDNSLICYSLSGLQDQMRSLGTIITLDHLLNRVMRNYRQGKITFVYADEFSLLFQEEETGIFFTNLWRRIRKYNGYCTGATQNVEEVLDSESGRTMLSLSDFVVMLNQSPANAEQLSQLYRISPNQEVYFRNVQPGHGLLKVGGALIPFVSSVPHNTRLYSLMSTNPREGKWN